MASVVRCLIGHQWFPALSADKISGRFHLNRRNGIGNLAVAYIQTAARKLLAHDASAIQFEISS
jgi:hypothetical protein